LKPEEVKYFEKSYIYKHSKFGTNSPLSLSEPTKTKRNAVLYRERLYFLSNAEEQQRFLKEPSKYTQSMPTIPLDLQIKPRVFTLGLPKSGKSTVCKMLNQRIGLVHLKMSKIITYFLNQDSAQGEQLRKHLKIDGRQLEDDMLVSLIIKRVQMKDCWTNGWVLEDFPKTRNQAMFLAKRGVVPTNVFYMRQSIEETYKRTHAFAEEKFGHNRTILATRIKLFQENMPQVTAFYSRLYNSLIEIDSTKSKWFIDERCLGEIQRNIDSR
jgi:adenylate/nucleoside-diphosphate kinase